MNYFGYPPVLCLTKHTCKCVYYAIEDSSVYNVATQLGLGRPMEANHVHIVPEVISSCDESNCTVARSILHGILC